MIAIFNPLNKYLFNQRFFGIVFINSLISQIVNLNLLSSNGCSKCVLLVELESCIKFTTLFGTSALRVFRTIIKALLVERALLAKI
jgi:hypothetical protein